MQSPTRRGRSGIGALPDGPRRPFGPDISEYSVADRVSKLGLTVSTITTQVEEAISRLVDEAITHQSKDSPFQLAAYACALEKERDARLLNLVFVLALERMKESWSSSFACAKLFMIMKREVLPTLQDNVTLDSHGQPVTGAALFLKHLHDHCYRSIEKAWQTKESAAELFAATPNDTTATENATVANQQWTNVVNFVQTSWEYYVIEETMMHTLIEKQLSTARPIEKDIDRLFGFLSPETKIAKSFKKNQLEKYYLQIQEVARKDNLSDLSRNELHVRCLFWFRAKQSFLIL
jgi:hypothetical protein